MLLSLRTANHRPLAASSTKRRLRLVLALAASALLLQLTGCANMGKVGADVSSYGQWPADRVHQKYVFERLPSQQAQADFQSRVEAAAAPMLARKGFVKVASPDQADVLVQVASQSRLYEDPYRFRNDGRFFGGFGFGGLWGGGRGGGIGLGISMEPAQTQMQVDVLIRDRRTNQTLYETHAVHERYGSASESTMPYLFEAALLDFPAQAISPRRVLIDVPSSTPAPVAATAAPAPKP